MPRLTLRAVNAALRALGHSEELVRGAGYFYFIEGDAHCWPSSSVYTFHLGGACGDTGAPITADWWVREHAQLRGAAVLEGRVPARVALSVEGR